MEIIINNIPSIRKIILSLSLFLILSSQLDAQNNTVPETDPKSVIIPGPAPFSLDATSAIYCIDLLKNNRFIEIKNDTGKIEIVEVHTALSIFLGLDENYPAGHHRRYDIIVNDNPLDWDKTFIEYGGEMLNLHLLFLYRNQYPPQGLEYNNNP